ncbi:hypothetical protein BDQ12DRAFT_717247 [Crucibulum laeve]|uniref:Uncharacterized protein n=1 Tax=Crucibulum laeve TaxID=68775 RepID=A0A5C3MJJ4_9AGAR|nr:hypothetical protein BDQ12DRAFT_727705 [Crucibulum laeve]TFK44058.1 hypothetical protein BDQ12DRAFT_717247 [Crucibulum laeve]
MSAEFKALRLVSTADFLDPEVEPFPLEVNAAVWVRVCKNYWAHSTVWSLMLKKTKGMINPWIQHVIQRDGPKRWPPLKSYDCWDIVTEDQWNAKGFDKCGDFNDKKVIYCPEGSE